MTNKKSIKAFSLAEMLVGLVISLIIFFIILTNFGVGQNSFENLRGESGLYSNIFSGFELIKNLVHKATGVVRIESWSNPPWKSSVLVVENGAFGLFQENINKPAKFVFLKDKNNINNQDIILDKLTSASLSFNQSPDGKLITVQIQGKSETASFNLSTMASRRN